MELTLELISMTQNMYMFLFTTLAVAILSPILYIFGSVYLSFFTKNISFQKNKDLISMNIAHLLLFTLLWLINFLFFDSSATISNFLMNYDLIISTPRNNMLAIVEFVFSSKEQYNLLYLFLLYLVAFVLYMVNSLFVLSFILNVFVAPYTYMLKLFIRKSKC